MAKKKPQDKRSKSSPRSKVQTQNEPLLLHLQSLSEADLTRQVLQPLLLKSGYHKVEYHGGVYEEGKDMICHRVDEFGDQVLTVIQVKKYRETVGAKAADTFSELVTQLQQAIEKPIYCLEGEVKPDSVVFITPYSINARSLASRFEKYDSLKNRGMKIIDGPKLVVMILKNMPEYVAKHLPGYVIEAGFKSGRLLELMRKLLDNSPLMAALRSSSHVAVRDFYTDIDFSLGKGTTKSFFETAAVSGDPHLGVTLNRHEWNALKEIDRVVKASYGFSLILQSYSEIESSAGNDWDQYQKYKDSRGNYQLVKIKVREQGEEFSEICRITKQRVSKAKLHLKDCIDDINECSEQLRCKRLELGEACDSVEVSEMLKEMEELKERAACLERCANVEPHSINVIISAMLRSVRNVSEDGVVDIEASRLAWFTQLSLIEEVCGVDSGVYLEKFREYEANERLLAQWESSEWANAQVPEPEQFHPTLDVGALSKRLESVKCEIVGKIADFRRGEPSSNALRAFIVKCQQQLAVVDVLFANKTIADALGVASGQATTPSQCRLEMSIQRVFATRVSLAVLGDAGAGKTTSLQMYAMRLSEDSELCNDWMFIPLGRMVSSFGNSSLTNSSTAIENIEAAICRFLQVLGLDIDGHAFQMWLRERPRVLLLDGVDEAIRYAPWVTGGIAALAEKYPGTQIVVSSRLSGMGIGERLPIMAVTLLPFNDRQQEAFIRARCGASEMKVADVVMRHVKTHGVIREVIRNPLLATVMCEIAMVGMDLPLSEVRLYGDRMSLLTGTLDTHKLVPTRVTTRQDDLIMIASKIAFWLHTEACREEGREVLYQIASERCQPGITAKAACRAVDELADVCEVLVPMTGDGKLGFGHLRYQEFLVACEMTRQQWRDLYKYLDSEWWHDSFVLFAQMYDRLDKMFVDIAENGLLGKSRRVVESMIRARPADEAVLRRVLQTRKSTSMSQGEIDSLVVEEQVSYLRASGGL